MNTSRQTKRQIRGTVFGAGWGVTIVLILVMLVQTWGIARSIREAQKGNVSTVELIQDCTTPGRACYERGQKQTGDAVASINRVSVFAAACADKPRRQTVEQIQSCVIARLAAPGKP